MYQYRIFSQMRNRLVRVALIAAMLFVFVLAIELVNLLHVIHHRQPILAYIFAAMLALFFIGIFWQYWINQRNHRILNARGYKLGSHPTHAELKKNLRHLTHCIKRLAQSRLLSDEQAATLHQKACDAEELFHHHPLNDDLQRAIENAREQIIAPAYKTLGQISEQLTRSKALAVTQDLYQPPFPIIAPLVVFYHQLTLISEITDVYQPHPSMREYFRVLSDVWQVMTKGDFLRFGQRLFSGINSNANSLGRAGEDLGQAMSIVWLTHAVSLAATQRCCTLHDWRLADAIVDVRDHLAPCLESTRDALLHDTLPILKKRIRHYAPVNVDPNVFVEEISASFIKSVESVVLAFNTTVKPMTNKGTNVGLVVGHLATPLEEVVPEVRSSLHHPSGRRRRRRRHHRDSSGFFGRWMDRIMRIGQDRTS